MILSSIVSVDLGIRSIKRSKSSSIAMFLALLIAITFILGTSAGTKYLQSSILIHDLDNVYTDLTVGITLKNDSIWFNRNNLLVNLNNLPYVSETFLKYHIRENWRQGNLSHFLFVDNRTKVASNFSWVLPQLDILGINSAGFKEYINSLNIQLENDEDMILQGSETVISHYLAQELSLTINDTIYLHYINTPDIWYSNQSLFNNSLPLTIRNIMTIPSKSNIAKEILNNPFLWNDKGILNHLVLLETETFLQSLDYLVSDNRERFRRNIILSVFLEREPLISHYNSRKSPKILHSIENNVLNALRATLPKGTEYFIENAFLNELNEKENDIKQLQQTLLIGSIPIVGLVFVITLYMRIITLNHEINIYGVILCRGIHNKHIRRSFLFEGSIIGIFASICSVIMCGIFALMLYFIIPTEITLYDWLIIYINDFPSYIVNALFLGLSVGFGINYIASRKIISLKPIDAVQIYRFGVTNWYAEYRHKIRVVGIPLTLILVLGAILLGSSSLGILSKFEQFVLENIISRLFLLVPIFILLLLIIIVTNRRDLYVRFMDVISFPLNKNLKRIMHLNHLRRPKNLSRVSLITTIAFTMCIAPIILSESAQNVSIRQIKTRIGSDIRITSTYEQLFEITPSNFYNLSPNIDEVTSIIWVDADLQVRTNESHVQVYQTGVLAIQPEKFVSATYFQDYFTPEINPNDLFSQLNSEGAAAVAQLKFKNVVSSLPVRFIGIGEENIQNFTIIGFYDLIPGFKQEYFDPPMPLICSLDFLQSTIAIPLDSHMSWFVKIDAEASKDVRTEIYQSIRNRFKGSEIFFLDNSLKSYLLTPSGSIVLIMNSIFFIVLVLSLFGLGLTFFQTFSERRAEVANYRSRGMSSDSIRKMFLFELLSIDIFGGIFGIVLGSITAMLYKDVLITPWPKIPVYLIIPWNRILFYIIILLVTHILSVLGQSYWSSRTNIINHLNIDD